MRHPRPLGAALPAALLTALVSPAALLTAPAQGQEPPPGTPPHQRAAEDKAGSPAGPAEGQEPLPRGVRVSLEGADAGYTLFTPLRSTNTYLVDAAGETVHTWPSEFTPGNSAYLLPDGSVLRCAKEQGDAPFTGGGEGGRLQRIAWDGELLWDYPMADTKWRQHHDIAPMPNGHVLAIIWEGVTPAEAMAAGRDEGQTPEKGMWPDAVIELAPDGPSGARVVWEWHAWDHLVQDRDPSKPNYGKPSEHPGRIDVNFDVLKRPKTAEELEREAAVTRRLRAMGYAGDDDEEEQPARAPKSDWMHTNSIDYDPEHDLIAISVRSASEVWILDHSTTSEEARTGEGGQFGHGGDLCYRFGRPKSYRGKGSQSLFSQHDARFVAVDGGLHMTVFNNGGDRPGGDRSSVDEYVLPFRSEGGFTVSETGAPVPAVLAWTFNGGEEVLFNSHISGAQRLPNGHMLMCLGEDGRTLEVTPEGQVVWDWLQPHAAAPGGEAGRRPEGGPGERAGRPGPPDGPGTDGERPPRGEGPPPEGRRGPPPGREGQRPGRGRGGRQRGGPGGGRGGRGPQSQHAIFRITRYAPEHPGLARLAGDR